MGLSPARVVPMIQLSPFHPEIDAVWNAVAQSGARSVAIVAAEPGEGTTLVAGALARRAGLSMAADRADGARSAVASLLVDLNLARPAVARVLGLRPLPGEVVRLDALGLAVLADIGVAGAEGWRERAQLASRLAAWRADWGLVVLDTAPLLSGDADIIPGATVAAAADATVLVTLAGRTPANRVREAREKLAAAGATVIGAVLNDRDNPSLLAELDRETWRLSQMFPRQMAGLRSRLHRIPALRARI
jgi:Mrp family chromosome partitioning ATPase